MSDCGCEASTLRADSDPAYWHTTRVGETCEAGVGRNGAYTPPLERGDTADYNQAIRRWTLDLHSCRAMIELLAPRPGEAIIDVGCGTGSFAIMLKAAEPGVDFIGIDPDEEALAIARAKADAAGADIRWERGVARNFDTSRRRCCHEPDVPPGAHGRETGGPGRDVCRAASRREACNR